MVATKYKKTALTIVGSTDEKLALINITVLAGSSALDEMREAKETAECQVLNISPLFFFVISHTND